MIGHRRGCAPILPRAAGATLLALLGCSDQKVPLDSSSSDDSTPTVDDSAPPADDSPPPADDSPTESADPCAALVAVIDADHRRGVIPFELALDSARSCGPAEIVA